MWFKKIRRKKLQCFLISLLLFLSALIFASSFSLITSISSYVNEYYSNPKYYNLIIFDENKNPENNIVKWCENNPKVKDFKTLDTFSSGNNLYYKGKKSKIANYDIIPIENYKNVPFGLSKIKSLNNSACPKEGEIWVTQLFANTYNLSLGDTLKFNINGKMLSFKISSLINDSLQPSSTDSQIIFYTNNKVSDKLSSFKNVELVFINPKKNTTALSLEKKLMSEINIQGSACTKDLLITSATMISSVLGGVCSLASLLVFIVSIFLIRFIMWNNILKEYESIGIYKSLGFTKKEILKIYISGYSIISFIGCTLGAFCSIPVLNITAAKTIKYIGDFNGVKINLPVILATILIFSLIVITNLYFIIRRTNKISPVDALRTGTTSSRKKLTKSLIKNSSSPLALAVNDIFKYKKITFCITLSLALSLTLMILFGNFTYTILKMKDNTNRWFAIPKSNVSIVSSISANGNELNDVLNQIKSDNRVKNYVYGSIQAPNIKIDTKYNIKSSMYGITVMNSYSNDLGFSIIDGHNPKNDNEVSVSLNILKESGLSVGDYIDLYVNNKKTSYLISGSFSGLLYDGYVIRMLYSEVENKIPNFKYDEIFLNIKNNSSIKNFEKEINDKYANIQASDIDPRMEYSINSIPGLIVPIASLLMISFVIFSIIIIFNIIIMNLRDNRKNFGIMKALGFTSGEIRNRYLYRIVLLLGISIIIAVTINALFSRSIIRLVMQGSDLLVASIPLTVILIIAMFILILLTVLICSTSINSSKPTDLIEE